MRSLPHAPKLAYAGGVMQEPGSNSPAGLPVPLPPDASSACWRASIRDCRCCFSARQRSSATCISARCRSSPSSLACLHGRQSHSGNRHSQHDKSPCACLIAGPRRSAARLLRVGGATLGSSHASGCRLHPAAVPQHCRAAQPLLGSSQCRAIALPSSFGGAATLSTPRYK